MSARRRSTGAARLAAVVGMIAAVSMLGFGPAAGAASDRSAAAAGPKQTISVGDNFFKPKAVSVVEGTTIVWKNKGKVLHAVRPNSGKLFGTSSLRRGKSYKFTFDDAGTYPYYCPIHSSAGGSQSGTIIVKPAPPVTTPTTVP